MWHVACGIGVGVECWMWNGVGMGDGDGDGGRMGPHGDEPTGPLCISPLHQKNLLKRNEREPGCWCPSGARCPIEARATEPSQSQGHVLVLGPRPTWPVAPSGVVRSGQRPGSALTTQSATHATRKLPHSAMH
jgi:hypothetical protein